MADALTVFRGDRLIFRDLSFAVPAGGALVLTGPNGAGKTTLLRVLAGLKRAEGGTVTLDGTAERAGRIGWVGHGNGVKPALTAAENLVLAGGDTAAALDAFGLASLAQIPARFLSAGQQRRLALARLLSAAAPLWLLDEPSTGLDAASLARFGAALATHRQAGGVVVAATHVPLPLPGAIELPLGAV